MSRGVSLSHPWSVERQSTCLLWHNSFITLKAFCNMAAEDPEFVKNAIPKDHIYETIDQAGQYRNFITLDTAREFVSKFKAWSPQMIDQAMGVFVQNKTRRAPPLPEMDEEPLKTTSPPPRKRPQTPPEEEFAEQAEALTAPAARSEAMPEPVQKLLKTCHDSILAQAYFAYLAGPDYAQDRKRVYNYELERFKDRSLIALKESMRRSVLDGAGNGASECQD